MIPFDPADPFPLCDPAVQSLAEARVHAARVDEWLGLDTAAVENRIRRRQDSPAPDSPGPELWLHVDVQVHQTPYVELRWMLHHLALAPGSTVVDLGAGYGRLGMVIGAHHPELTFLGYELAPERVEAGAAALARWPAVAASLTVADLAAPAFRPLPADLYFLYDFGTRSAIEKALLDLAAVARTRPVTLVGRGRAVRDAIERRHPWLGDMVAPEHHGPWSVYRSRG